MFALIRRTFQHIDRETFTPLYKSLVRTHLDFASPVWSPYKAKDIERIENVQDELPNNCQDLKISLTLKD
jgi:hypothetical protein